MKRKSLLSCFVIISMTTGSVRPLREEVPPIAAALTFASTGGLGLYLVNRPPSGERYRSTAPNIIGNYLFNKDRTILYKLAQSKNLWEKRISILSTAYFIRNNQFEDTLKISEILLNDNHDLIHKAVGWMLREVGKKDQEIEEQFLKKYYQKMPRTMLRYAIERFEETKRKSYLKK